MSDQEPDSGAAALAMRVLYMGAGAAAAAGSLLRGAFADGEEAEKRRQRRGIWPARRERGPWVWLQAASVGEADLALALARELRLRRPGLAFVVSSMTDTGRARVQREQSVESRYFPIDFAPFSKRIVQQDPPLLYVSIETEIWPETWKALQDRGVPVAVANARLSDRSVPRYRHLHPFLGPLLCGLAKVCARDEEQARRWVAIGAREEAVEVAGNIKFDLALAGETAGTAKLFPDVGGRPLVLAASTHDGEEGPVLDAFAKARAAAPGLRLVVAPRHPERAGAVAALAKARGWNVLAWSDLAAASLPAPWPDGADVVVLDRLGLLRSAYACADVAFVGGSLVPGPGGHNLLEAVVEGCPVVTGAFLGNVEDQASLLREAGVLRQVPDVEGLAKSWLQVLADPGPWRDRLNDAAALLDERRGALARTVDALDGLLGDAASGRPQ